MGIFSKDKYVCPGSRFNCLKSMSLPLFQLPIYHPQGGQGPRRRESCKGEGKSPFSTLMTAPWSILTPPTGHLGGGILKKAKIPLTTGPSKKFPSGLRPDRSFRGVIKGGGEGTYTPPQLAWAPLLRHWTALSIPLGSCATIKNKNGQNVTCDSPRHLPRCLRKGRACAREGGILCKPKE